jgi:hypothetical protein
MKKTILLLAIAAATISLGGCESQDEQTVDRSAIETQLGLDPAPLYFAYPAAGQQSVPTTTPIILRYTSSIITAEEELTGHFSLESSDGQKINFKSAELTENDQGLILTPETLLKPATDYVIVSDGKLALSNQLGTLPSEALMFRTAAANQGPLSLQMDGSDGFSLQRISPYSLTSSDMTLGSDKYPITDISTLRLQFSEPLKSESLIYNLLSDGGTVALIDGKGKLVAAKIISRGHRLTIDPEEDLNPALNYQLILSSAISSAISETPLEEVTLSVTPVSTLSPEGIRERVPQVAINDGGVQKLTGKTNNSVGLDSILLGTGNKTIQSGNVFADLAFIPTFESLGQSIPLRIEAGTKLTGTNVPVKVAGEFPAGFESETINVHFLSDADGYLMPNPYTNDPSAPRIIEIYADLSMTTENTIANGGLAQSLLHVQLVGTAIVEEGRLVLETVGIIEPEVLGLDTASGLISFKLEGYRNASDVPDAIIDVVSPTIKSWVPGNNLNLLRPGDPIVVFFSEPLDSSSVTADSFSVSENGSAIEGKLTLNGSAVTFTPSETFKHNTEYTLNLSNELKDLVGNTISPVQESFSLPTTVDMPEGAPTNQAVLALTSQPGYPCAKTAGDPSAGNQGRCLGGNATDDLIPVLAHPSTRSITVGFSQNINPESINSDTVIVEVFENDAWAPANVETILVGRNLSITPTTPWAADTLYRYTLVSGNEGIRSTAGLPLQTEFMDQGIREESERVDGGANLINYFLGGSEETRVFLPLKNLSAADINGDLEINSGELGVSVDDDYSPIPNSSQVEIPAGSVESEEIHLTTENVPIVGGLLDFLGLGSLVNDAILGNVPLFFNPVTGAQIGCEVGESCPENSFIYMTAGLDTAVSNEINESTEGRARVKLHPTTLYTSSVDVHVELDPILEGLLSLTGGVGAIPTGPMSMRMRFQEDDNGDRNQLIDGFISTIDGQLTFETELDVYLDAPYLAPDILGSKLDHNLRSFPINNLKLRGAITFLDDGRMQIEQRNVEVVNLDGININGDIGIPTVLQILTLDITMSMRIPQSGLYLNYLSPITQKH